MQGTIYEGLFGDAEIGPLFSDEAAIAEMLRFEGALARVEAGFGIIPSDADPAIAEAMRNLSVPSDILREGTASAGIPVPALVAWLREAVPAPHGQYVHWGATSQDVMDTALVLRLAKALSILEHRLHALIGALAEQARTHADLPMAGRTRSQVAAPTTFGLRIAGWAAPLIRAAERLAELRPRVLILQFGGAVGTLSVLGEKGPEVMDALAADLGLGTPPKPWHAERDGLDELAHWLANLSASLARMGSDLILLGRTEIGEVTAGSGGGSSTMPQKSNPVLAEALVTIGRRAPAEALVMTQAIVHTEERDATAWASEWSALPALAIGTGAGLRHANELARTLKPAADRMRRGMELNGGAIHAEALAFALAAQIALPEAQAMVKAASRAVAASGGTLGDHLAAACRERGIEPPKIDDTAVAANARAFIERTFARYPR